jgi:hypothetical protein
VPLYPSEHGDLGETNLDIVSYSAGASPASNENRIRAFSVPFGAYARRFEVLRFLGMMSSLGPGVGLFRPRSLFPGCVSTPAIAVKISYERSGMSILKARSW